VGSEVNQYSTRLAANFSRQDRSCNPILTCSVCAFETMGKAIDPKVLEEGVPAGR